MEDLSDVDTDHGVIPLDRCRQLLGDEAIDLSDEEIDRVRRQAAAMAHVVVELFLAQEQHR